jgi:hypothetical protein
VPPHHFLNLGFTVDVQQMRESGVPFGQTVTEMISDGIHRAIANEGP